MFDHIWLGREFFERLTAVDAEITAKVAAMACWRCGGPLHVGNYPRKPRGGLFGIAGETLTLRYSLCCGREGCRRRTTPPSVRFLGRRVYLGAVVIVASIVALAMMATQAREATGIATRTARRWIDWWQVAFPQTPVFTTLSGRLRSPVSRSELPASVLACMPGSGEASLACLLAWLAPLTTASTPEGARFVRVAG